MNANQRMGRNPDGTTKPIFRDHDTPSAGHKPERQRFDNTLFAVAFGLHR